MRKRKITGRILTGLVALIDASETVTVANEINNFALNVNIKSVKSNIVEKNGRYYVQLTSDRDVKNVVARITTENKKDYLFKKDNIIAGEVIEYEIDINSDVPTKKLLHIGIIKETVKNIVNVGNHTFNIIVRYDVEVEDNAQPIMQVTKTNTTNPTFDQLIDKKEISAEERLKEAEVKAKQGITVANSLPTVTAAELADPAMNELTDHAKKMKVALAKNLE